MILSTDSSFEGGEQRVKGENKKEEKSWLGKSIQAKTITRKRNCEEGLEVKKERKISTNKDGWGAGRAGEE